MIQLAQLNKISTKTLLTELEVPTAATEMHQIAEEVVESQKVQADAMRQAQNQQPQQQQAPQEQGALKAFRKWVRLKGQLTASRDS